jgi:amino acid adenylation domain-containing protein
MTVARLLEELSRHSVDLWIEDGKLRVSAPPGVLTPELVARLRAERDGILAVLESTAEPLPDLEPISAHPPEEPVPLTQAQYQLWFLSQLAGNAAMLNVPLTLRLRGELDVGALERAVRSIGRRHDALTSRVLVLDDMPFQVNEGVELTLKVEDYSELGVTERERVVFTRRAEELSRPIDPAWGPLARFFLFKLSAREHILVVVASHLVFDGASQSILMRELTSLYEHHASGAPAPEAPACRFGDFAHFSARLLDRSRAADLAYFREKLAGMPSSLTLPFDHPRPARASHLGSKCFAWLDAGLVGSLRRLAAANNATLSMVALACIELLIARYSGQSDFGLGVPSEGRERPETENLIGMFVNTLVLRSDVAAGGTFRELLARVRSSQIEALAHRNVPHEELHRLLGANRDQSRANLFQVLFSFQDARGQSLRMGQAEIEVLPSFTGAVLTDLTFWLRDHGDQAFLAVEAASDLFDAETTGRLFRSLQQLIEYVVENPDSPLERIPVVAPEDESYVLDELNATETSWDDTALVHRLFEREVDRRPEAVALLFEEQSLTYRELDERANQLAHLLVEEGVGPDARVGIYLPRGLELVIAMLATLKAGGAYVGLDRDYPVERVQELLADSEASVLISTAELASRLSTRVPTVLVDRDQGRLRAESTARLQHPERSDQLAYVIYTSGSTGKPKGVMVEHRNVTSFFVGVEKAIALDASGVWLASASICFDMSTIEILGSLCHGARLVVLGQAILGEVEDPRYTIPSLVARHGITHIQCTPSQAKMLALEESGRRALARLRQLLLGGEALPQSLADELTEIVPGEVINVYGPTETTVYATTSEPLKRGQRVTLGRPLPNTVLFVVDALGQPVPFGVAGELYIGGPGVTRGYLGRPELTRERFIPNTIRPELCPRLYRTGDLVRYAPDGTLLYLGRNDFQVKIRGYRIELGEIEAAIRERDGVDDVVVTAHGEGTDKRLVAYLATNDRFDGDAALKENLEQRLPHFMVPSSFVHLPALPLNANGKVDRSALPAPELSAAPAREFVAPRTELERRLCEIWSDALGASRVGIRDDFFDLGGHSIVAVKLSNEVYRCFGVRLPLATLFECPTVESFARRLEELGRQGPEVAAPARWSTLVKIKPRGSLPPFFCVAGVGGNPMNLRHLAAELGDDQPFYGLQFRGVDGQHVPHRRIEDMAEEFLADVRRVQSSGPYYLGGYSAGGLAAYEMARLLQARGERVGLVVLFDTLNPTLPAWSLRERFDAHMANFRRRGVAYVPARVLARLREEVTGLSRAVRARLATHYPFAFRHDAVWTAAEEAIRAYRPEPAPFDVLLIRADPALSAGGGIGYRPHESNGWRGVVTGELEIVELACSHSDLVGAHAAALAGRALERSLAAARERQARASLDRRSTPVPRSDYPAGAVRLTG